MERVKGEVFGVGYKRPPKQHHFKKGQSGNPKGRPKARALPMSERSANALALKQAERLIAVREGEETNQISAIEAVYRAQYATACKGNAYAQKHAIERYDRAERELRCQIQASIESAEVWVAAAREAIVEAERKGDPPSSLLPHPDDVVIDQEMGVRLVGPLDEKGLTRLEETCRMRDMLIMQDALDDRAETKSDSNDPLDKSGTALLFAMILNQAVPHRFKLNDNELGIRRLHYGRIPKRQLLKDIYRGWRALGAHPPRGKTFPPLRMGKAMIEFLFDLAQHARDGHMDIVESMLEEHRTEIARFMRGR